MEGLKVLYHETNREDARLILQGGFRDEGSVLVAVGPDRRCVYVADKPPLLRDARDRAIIVIDADHLSHAELKGWERTRSHNANVYREWCIPAARLNAGKMRLLE